MRIALFAAFVLAAAVLGGCEESVDPILGTERAFSVYGFLDPRADTQAVRVFPIEGRLERTRPDPLDAVVTAEALDTGVQTVWTDTLVRYQSPLYPDAYGHVFFARMAVAHEQAYRLTVSRSDGVTAAATVTVPPVAEPTVRPSVTEGFEIRIPVFWARAPRLNQIEVAYQLTVNGRATEVAIPYAAARQRPEGDGVVMDVQFRDDALTIRRTVNSGLGGRIALLGIEQRVLVSNAEWAPPGGVYDPDVLVQPGVFSNVEDGFGFFGAGYPDTTSWVPDSTLIRQVGLEPPPPPEDEEDET
jgi:hypothetical protein